MHRPREVLGVLPVILAGLALPGCAAGVIGLTAAIVGLSGSGGGSQAPAPDLPPVVRFSGQPELLVGPEGGPSRYRIRVRYSVTNEDEGTLAARVEAMRVDGQGEPIGEPVLAAALPGCGDALDGIPSGVERSFCWDVPGTPGFENGASMVHLLITAVEDSRENEATQPSDSFLAGNTPLTVRNLTLAQNGEVLFSSFDLVDAEADSVPADERFLQLDLEVEGSAPVRLDPTLLGRPSFPAAPEPGAQGSFSLDLARLRAEGTLPEPLRALGEPGFVGTLAAQLRVRDFLEEAFAVSPTAALLFDNNELPLVAIDSVGLDDPQSGVVSIRYRIFDPDLNSSDVEVEVDLSDGLGFRPALELPRPPSEGRAGLCALDPSVPDTPGDCAGPAGTRAHVFLWDALAQTAPAFRPTAVRVRASARDRESGPAATAGPTSFRLPLGFTRVREEAVGEFPGALAAADFDRDGFPDLAVANFGSANVTLLRGSSAGLTRVREEPAGLGPRALAAADFDQDGYPDLAVANQDSDNVTYFRGSTAGLTRVREEPVGGEVPAGLAVADFDQDGFPDLAVANASSDNLTLLRGSSAGLTRVREEPAGDFPSALAAADFDQDGYPDLAVANRDSDNVTFLRGSSMGFTSVREERVGNSPVALAAADFDQDGFPDLAAANTFSANVTYLRGSSAGLTRVREEPAGDFPRALAAADFDQDGFPDLAVANQFSDNVSFLRGSAAGLTRVREEPAGSEPTALAAADFDQDGFPDLAANPGSDNVTFLRGSASGLTRVREEPAGSEPTALAAADFDQDGFPDLAVANQGSDNVTFLRGSSAGLTRVREEPAGNRPLALAAADFDQDGFPDLAVANFDSNNVTFLRGSSAGLTRVREEPAGVFPGALAAADFDQDGFPDLAVANFDSNNVTFLRGSSAGLTRVREEPAGNRPLALAAADFDQDGFPDLAVANFDSNNVTFLRGSSAGLTRVREEPAGNRPLALAAADFDQDGFPDLAVANFDSNNVTFLRGSSAGLTRVREEPAGNRPRALAAADFDQDGFPDLAVANLGSDDVTFLRQLVLRHHINLFLDPAAPGALPSTLLDPRSPPGHELEIPPGALSAPTQIAILPAAPFELPLALGRDAAGRNRALVRLTLAVSLLPASTMLAVPACLKLRVREGAEDLVSLGLAERSRLRIFRADPATGEVRDVALDPKDPKAIERIPFGRGLILVQGLAFSIQRFGTYVVAVEVDR